MPYLNFDIHTIWSKPQERWPLYEINGRFKDFVNWVLMFQNSSIDIQNFRLRCLSFSDDDHTLQRWMTVATRRNLKQLHLKLLPQIHTPIHRLPHCLVTCGSLVELKLEFEDQRCVVELPIYPGFSSLKCLDLHMIEFLDSNLLKNFISSCPVIESLKMESCLFGDFKILEICSASLKNLILDTDDFCEPNCDGLANCEIKVACPSLVSFYFLTASTWNFTFQDLNSLQAGFVSYHFLPKHATAEECHNVRSKILVQVLKQSVGFLKVCIVFYVE